MSDLNHLKKLFDFTDADLAANRKGELSEHQRELCQLALVKTRISAMAQLLTFVMFILSFIAFIVFNLMYSAALGPLVLVDIAIWLALVFLLMKIIAKASDLLSRHYEIHQSAWISRIVAHSDSRHWQAIEAGVVQHASGQLRLQSDGEHIHLFLGNIDLTNNVAGAQDMRLWRLQPDTRYVLYYVFDPLWIVALEPV